VLWQAALSELELQMTKATFATWVRPVELLPWESEGDDNGGERTCVILATPNEYVKDWVENRLYTPIQRTLSGLAGNTVEIEFEVRDHLSGQDLPLSNS
jgi:chromosomal replication initiation ATPase DnaA